MEKPMRKFLLAAALPFLAVPFLTTGAGAIELASMTGSAGCSSATGERVITWTFELFLAETAALGTPTVTPTPADPSASTTAFSPNPLVGPGTATATTTLDGDFVGSVQMTLPWSVSDFEDESIVGVEVAEPCPPPPTTTTTSTTTTIPTTTTAPAVAAAAVARTPTFTG